MRFPYSILKATTVTAGVLVWGVCFTQPAGATDLDQKPPEARTPDPDPPLFDHTAQDDPMREHTAQDGMKPPTTDPHDKLPPFDDPVQSPIDDRRGGYHPLPDDPHDALEVPILDVMGIDLPDAPNVHDFTGGPANAITLFDQLNLHPSQSSDGGFIGSGVSITATSVPSPGGLVLIGLGGLMLRRRRRG